MHLLSSVTDIAWLEGKSAWKDMKTIIQYRSWRNGVQSERHYTSSADKSAEEFYRSIRGHWSIENCLHWSLDMVFKEDAAQVSKDHTPENLNIYLHSYNYERAHQGRNMNGRTPHQVFVEGLPHQKPEEDSVA